MIIMSYTSTFGPLALSPHSVVLSLRFVVDSRSLRTRVAEALMLMYMTYNNYYGIRY